MVAGRKWLMGWVRWPGLRKGDGWKLQVKVRLAVYPVTQGYLPTYLPI